MKKPVLFIISLLLSICMAICPDTAALAASGTSYIDSIRLYVNESQSVFVSSVVNRYFCFIPQISGNYIIDSSGSFDTYAYAYDSSLKQLAYDDDSGVNQNFNIFLYLTKGEKYYFRVSTSSVSSGGGYYQIGIGFDNELNSLTSNFSELTSSAVAVNAGYNSYCFIDDYGKYAVYCFTPERTAEYLCKSVDSYFNTYGFLFTSDGRYLSSNNGYNGYYNFSLYYGLNAGTTYYYVVRFNSFSIIGGFNVSIDFAPHQHISSGDVIENSVPSSCTVNGTYQLVNYCSICGREFLREDMEYSLTPHTFGRSAVENVVKATASSDGSYQIASYCAVCGNSYDRNTVTVNKAVVKLSKKQLTFSGKNIKPTVKVTDSSGAKLSAKIKTTLPKTSKKVGRYDVTVKISGDYYLDTVKTTYDIVPKKGKVNSVKALSGGMVNVSWSKTKGASGYEVQVSKSKNFKKNTKRFKTSNTKFLNGNLPLDRKTYYYIRVRSFQTVKYKNKKIQIYSPWSTAKGIKTK